MTSASIQRVMDLAGRLEGLLLSVGDARYSRDLGPLINTAAAITFGAIRTINVELPIKASRRACRVAEHVQSFYEGSCRAAEWALQQGWHDVRPEVPIDGFGKPDLFIQSQSVIIEVGDCRTDKPLTGISLGYVVLVVPVEPMSIVESGSPADATLFLPGSEVDALDVLFEKEDAA